MVHTMSTPSATPDKPLRRDAERNRQRILDAARIVFAERGLRASHDEIAREAGVGVGTVYRRFPDKEQLIDALFVEGIESMVEIAEAGLAMDDPWEGLAHFLVGGQELQCADRGLKELVLGEEGGQARVARARERVSPLVEALLARAQASGSMRADVVLSDLPMIQIALGAVVDATRDIAPEAWRRAMVLMLDGLRTAPPAASPFPVPPLSVEEFEAAMQASHGGRRH